MFIPDIDIRYSFLQPLLSMPSSDTMPLEREEDEEEESESLSPRSTPYGRRISPLARPGSVGHRPDSRISNAGTSSTLNSRPNSGMPQDPLSRPHSSQGMGRAKSLTRLNGLNGTSTKLTGLQRSTVVR